jgi:hypothetical protein
MVATAAVGAERIHLGVGGVARGSSGVVVETPETSFDGEALRRKSTRVTPLVSL